MRHAALAATLIEPRHIGELSFSEADRENHLFISIEERLRVFGSSLAEHWSLGKRYVGIYTMRLLPSGDILFGPENIPPDDPRASPPGTRYKEPPAEIRRVFAGERGLAVGPYTDEYGTYVSAFIPIIDPATHHPVAVLGMDIEASDWYFEVGKLVLFPALLIILIIVLSISWHLRAVTVQRLYEQEEEYRLLTENAVSGVAVHEMLFDEKNRPVDYVFLYANPAFERHTGLAPAAVIGRRVTEVIPGIEKSSFIERYGQVVLSGKPASFEEFAEPLGRHYFVNAYRIGKTRFAAVFTDITDRKNAEEKMRILTEKQAELIHRLERQKQREEILTELRQFLQATATIAETGPIIEKIMQKLFPYSSGALYLMSASRTDLDEVSRWGQHHEAPENMTILPDECWGIRRGGLYIVEDPATGLLCRHIVCQKPGRYACLPLMAHGEVLGLLHVCETPGGEDGSGASRFLDSLREISGELSEILSLSIANIRLRETLTYQSIKDPLTGLFNRRYLEETFVRETSRARRHRYPIGIIMCDIDHFKKFNDLYGHTAGDAVLAEVGRFLARSLRTADIVCRYGGEEFALILPEASLEHTRMRAEELCRRARDLRILFEDKTLGPITLSFGVAAYPVHGNTLDTVLRAADAALYRAKQQGRNQVVAAEMPE